MFMLAISPNQSFSHAGTYNNHKSNRANTSVAAAACLAFHEGGVGASLGALCVVLSLAPLRKGPRRCC